MKIFKIFTSLIISALFLGACASMPQEEPIQIYPRAKAVISYDEYHTAAQEAAAAADKDKLRAKELLSQMTLEEKTGQLFILSMAALNGARTSNAFPVTINDLQVKNLKKYNPGGVVFYAKNVTNDDQIKKYIFDLNLNSKLPLFVTVDEEGGLISRLGDNDKVSVSKIPPMQELGQNAYPQEVFEVARILGRQLRALGFNLNLAPVADVATNPLSPNVAKTKRAFSADAAVASVMVARFTEAMQGEKVSAVLKHFPGIGSTVADTHKTKVSLPENLDTLRKREFLPFKSGIEAGADFVMLSHVFVPEITADETPASLSEVLITEILKKELGFNGLIITDDLLMDAVISRYTVKEAAVKSFLAGSDIFIFTGTSFIEAYDAILAAAKAGEITQERLDETVLKILETKIKRAVL